MSAFDFARMVQLVAQIRTKPLSVDETDLSEIADQLEAAAEDILALGAERDATQAALDELLEQVRVRSPYTNGSESLASVMQRRYGRSARQWQANHDQRKAERDALRTEVELLRKELDKSAKRTPEPGELESMLAEAVDYACYWGGPVPCTDKGAGLIVFNVEFYYRERGYEVEATCEWVSGERETKPLVTVRAKP